MAFVFVANRISGSTNQKIRLEDVNLKAKSSILRCKIFEELDIAGSEIGTPLVSMYAKLMHYHPWLKSFTTFYIMCTVCM